MGDSTKDNVKKFDLTLLCNNEKSIYADLNAKEYYEYIKSNRNINNIKIPKSKGNVYRDNEKLIVTLLIGLDLYSYDEPKLTWELISNTSKKISQYPCQLAKTITDTGDVFYAWYTPDISIFDGPFRFKGLPGMILEVYNFNKTIHIYAIETKKSTKIIEPLKISSTIYHVDKKSFLKKRAEFIENPNYRMNSMEIIFPDGSSSNNVKVKISNQYLLD